MPEIALPTAAKQDEILENLKVRNENGLALKKVTQKSLRKTNEYLSTEIYKYTVSQDYVYIMKKNKLLQLDADTFNVVAEIKDVFYTGSYSAFMELDGDYLYTVTVGLNSVAKACSLKKIDTRTFEIVKQITFTSGATTIGDLTITDNYICVVGQGSGGSSIFEKGDFTLYHAPTDLFGETTTFENDVLYSYLYNGGSGALYKYDISTKTTKVVHDQKNIYTSGMYIDGDFLYLKTNQYLLKVNKSTLAQVSYLIPSYPISSVTFVDTNNFKQINYSALNSSANGQTLISVSFSKITSDFESEEIANIPLEEIAYTRSYLQPTSPNFASLVVINDKYFYYQDTSVILQFKYITKHIGYEEV